MKKNILIAILLMSAVLSNAQDNNYNGAAKVTVKNFWDGALKLEQSIAAGGSSLDRDKLANLQKKIADTKIKDPFYNISGMEKKLKSLAEGMIGLAKNNEASKQAYNDKFSNSQNVDQSLRSLFNISTQVNSSKLGTIKDEIANYKKLTNEVVAMDKSSKTSDLERYLKSLKLSCKTAEKDITELDRRCREQTEVKNAEVNYYQLVVIEAFWDAAQKIYPNEPDFAKAQSIAAKYVKDLGNISDLQANANKVAMQIIKDRKVPDAVTKDPSLEKMFMEVFDKTFGTDYKGKAYKAVITQRDWDIRRNEVSGVIIGRERSGTVIFKATDGKCYLSKFDLWQDYIGSTFQGAKMGSILYGKAEILCENAK